MRITKYDHACVLVEADGARILIDPGTFSPGFERLTDLTAVLITHQHLDHVDVERLGSLLQRNRSAPVFSDPASAGMLSGSGIEATPVLAGDTFDAGLPVTVHGADHGLLHADVPVVPNVGYLVNGRFYHPGDSWTIPDAEVDLLCVPTAAPWITFADAIDFMRAVRPRTAVPIHEALLAKRDLYYALFERLRPEQTTVRVLATGEQYDF